MAWRIVGGLGGWLGSLAPLVIVNILAFTTAIDPSVIPIAGSAALLLGIALGGTLAGLLGGKRGAGWGGVMAGAIAAALLAGTLIALGVYLRAQHQLPYLLALHPIRTVGAIGFIGCLVIGVAALVGAIAGNRGAPRATAAASVAARRPAMSASRPYPPSGVPRAPSGVPRAPSRPISPSQPSQRGASASRETRRIAESRPRERSPRW
jgi:hypothetical protein